MAVIVEITTSFQEKLRNKIIFWSQLLEVPTAFCAGKIFEKALLIGIGRFSYVEKLFIYTFTNFEKQATADFNFLLYVFLIQLKKLKS